ncbi:PREDICTED: uncharacterized protein LOC105462207, partial [Wasmannia auropunctata]|uniref:uncharacterized protein LOC105462207 n=1 Tax=Wasmannia auropunctata TaxID=64793 RepID=UPI0005EF9549
WIAPILIFAKIFLQDLWLAGCGWDDALTPELAAAWGRFRESLPGLEAVGLPRWLGALVEDDVELHGFSDASERAYAAVVYTRVTRRDGGVLVSLLTARTKVAPVKTQSVPRLELCGAVFLARLLDRLVRGLGQRAIPVVAWTDAQVVLCWLRGHASRWKPFVAHRVAEVQGLVPGDRWRYVPTGSNPADLATRGVPVSELGGLDLWWNGPKWLREASAYWPESVGREVTIEAEQEQRSVHLIAGGAAESQIEERFSSLSR